ncbi:DUF2652 domain-containing protein [Muriicola sp. Z0-33]|uniref:DUF2652 domain-containing protein n=1 Tax=Muriicola sp. Z0-33 TaxID=2816957 RepID=UPI0022387E71|nr:DUF2652 domain-containing protein [Muriicola sp. Z0-33]
MMPNSLLFIPDISGFTKFIQTTEVEHSQHVIAELLEVLIEANTEELRLAEIEGDALFFYKEGEVLSQERLLAQMETMFTAFHSHLKMLEKNRICPCNACSSAPDLQLKIVAHCGELQYIEVQGRRKPFGQQVIEAHRLLKNSIDSENYVLVSQKLAAMIELPADYVSKVYQFNEGTDHYDGNEVGYMYAIINNDKLSLNTVPKGHKVQFNKSPNLVLEEHIKIPAALLLEYVSNYGYRHLWVKGVDEFIYSDNEVTRLGSAHLCVINGKHLNFVAVTKDTEPGQYIYGEMTTSIPIMDEAYQFYIITPTSEKGCRLQIENYWMAKSPFKKLFIFLFAKKLFRKNTEEAIKGLAKFAVNNPVIQ